MHLVLTLDMVTLLIPDQSEQIILSHTEGNKHTSSHAQALNRLTHLSLWNALTSGCPSPTRRTSLNHRLVRQGAIIVITAKKDLNEASRRWPRQWATYLLTYAKAKGTKWLNWRDNDMIICPQFPIAFDAIHFSIWLAGCEFWLIEEIMLHSCN